MQILYMILATYPGQEAHQRLHMISGHRIPHKSQRFPAYKLQKPLRIELRQLAVVGLPPPFQEPGVGPPELEAVLVLLNCVASVVGIIWSVGIRHPFPRKQVALLLVGNPRPYHSTAISPAHHLHLIPIAHPILVPVHRLIPTTHTGIIPRPSDSLSSPLRWKITTRFVRMQRRLIK